MKQCAYRDWMIANGQTPPPEEEDTPAWKVTLALVMSFGVAIWLSQEYGAWLTKVNWSMVTGLFGGIVFAMMFYRWAKEPNTFDPLDMFLDPVTRRVSPWRVYIAITFAVGMWLIVTWSLGKVPERSEIIVALYGSILTGLVAKIASGEWADVKANRQPSIAQEPTPPAQAAQQGQQ